ncbi:hypothetical protein D3C85_1518870 [compost metagenome]
MTFRRLFKGIDRLIFIIFDGDLRRGLVGKRASDQQHVGLRSPSCRASSDQDVGLLQSRCQLAAEYEYSTFKFFGVTQSGFVNRVQEKPAMGT